MNKFDVNILNNYVRSGLVRVQSNKSNDLFIYNYTKETEFNGLWDEITTKTRSLVLDISGNVIARGFDKFFNYEQLSTLNINIPNEKYEIFEKLDGYLILLFNYNNEWIITSRGSFDSDYVNKANELIKKYDVSKLDKNFTYCFELIWTDNPIVVKYDNDDLIMTAKIKTIDGQFYQIDDYKNLGFNVVNKINSDISYNDIKNIIKDDEEGYVIRFESGFMMKIKGENYFKLHKLVRNINIKTLYEYYLDNNLDEFKSFLPDEYFDWYIDNVTKIKQYYNKVWEYYVDVYNDIYNKYNGVMTKKEFHNEVVNKYINSGSAILYGIYDQKCVDKHLNKIVYSFLTGID